MKIAVCLPTRGLIFAQTIEAILKEIKGITNKIIIVSGLPIPDSHNTCVEKALKTSCDYILFVEEDVVIPEGGLRRMMEMAREDRVLVIDYPLEGSKTSYVEKNGEVLWSSMGCMMVPRKVFEEMPRPWFRTDKSLLITDEEKFEFREIDTPNKYGGHDVLFGLYLKSKGIKIVPIEGMKAKHLRLKSWERKTVNNGVHEIYELKGEKDGS